MYRNHPIWRCSQFKSMNSKGPWKTAKKHKLCCRCLCSNYRGNNCKQLEKCGIDGCTETHNRLLHDKNEKKKTKIKKARMNLTVERMINGMVLLLLMELFIMSIVIHQWN